MNIEDKLLLDFLYKLNKEWIDMWKWIQIQANKGFPLDEVVLVLREYEANKERVGNPWAYCTTLVNEKIEQIKNRERERKWNKVKQQEKDFAHKLADLIKNIGRPI